MLKKLKSILLDNLPIKLFSLLFAVLLWMYASTRGQSEITFVVPLELRDIPAGMMVVGDPLRQVDVRLKGDEVSLRNLSSREVGAFISLGDADAGESLYSLDPSNIKAPRSVTLISVSPSEVRIALDFMTQRRLPVRVRISGSPAAGYKLTGVDSDPEEVTVTGPKDTVEKLEEVVTEDVNIDGLVGGFEKQIHLEKPDNKYLSMGTAAVQVRVDIEKVK